MFGSEDESKQLFPYELFKLVEEIKKQVSWPVYTAFKSCLGRKKSHVAELEELVPKFSNLCELFEYFGVDNSFDPKAGYLDSEFQKIFL